LAAYPLSRRDLKGKKLFLFLILFTMFFNGGIIPDYLLVNNLGLTNNMWGLIIPCGLNTFNLIILRTFFVNSIPQGIEEAARIDGSNDFNTLIKIVLPLSMPVLATLTLFYAVARWNGFQDAKFYINKQQLYILPQKINMVINSSQIKSDAALSNPELAKDITTSEGIKAASIMFTTLPILLLYPWLQKYFVNGVMIGAIKG
jgi:putative aldouronate transport system permease protein